MEEDIKKEDFISKTLLILGPTGTGKSAVPSELASYLYDIKDVILSNFDCFLSERRSDRHPRKNLVSSILSGILKKNHLKHLSDKQILALALKIASYLYWFFQWLLRQKTKYIPLRFIDKKKYQCRVKKYILSRVRRSSSDNDSFLDTVTRLTTVTFDIEKRGILSCPMTLDKMGVANLYHRKS